MLPTAFGGLAGVSLVLALVLSPARLDQDRRPFDRAEWLAHVIDKNGYCTRYEMVGDLLRTHKLVGMTRAEAVALLGPASSETSGRWDPGRMHGMGHRTARPSSSASASTGA